MAGGVLGRIKSLFTGPARLAPGMYHYRIDDGDAHTRAHLRVDADGDGVLVLNASKVLHLNRTATEMAKLHFDGVSVGDAVEQIARRYTVGREQAAADFSKLAATIGTLMQTDDLCPVSYLEVEEIEPFSTPTAVPYRMDLALTYRCQNACDHCYNCEPAQRGDVEELSTDQWKQVLRRLFDLGVPHVCFTGGEATLREDLWELVEAAEDVGLVTGLLTNGRRLADEAFLDRLITAGLDHIQITLESCQADVHDGMVGTPGAFEETLGGLRNAIARPVYVTTNTTLTRRNVATIEATVDFLASLGLTTFCCNGIIHSGKGEGSPDAIAEAELAPILDRVHERAHRRGLRMIWYTPTRYCRLNPIELGLGPKQCTACKFNLCIEPNGDVLPCQSYYQPLGNFLRDPWESIWDHPVAQRIRARESLPFIECPGCPHLDLCAGGCPLYRDTDEDEMLCVESRSTF